MSKNLLAIQQQFKLMGVGSLTKTAMASALDKANLAAGHSSARTSERGNRATPENSLKYLYQRMWVDPGHRAAVLDIRAMDREDGRVKKIHKRMANTATKGGLKIKTASTNKRLIKRWGEFEKRLKLNRSDKLKSDARGLAMEGNLPIQWVLDTSMQVVAGVRMPSETLKPVVNQAGIFIDPRKAYEQWDLIQGRAVEAFALWQLSMGRIDPDNFDDMGSMGRPYLDASRTIWKKLVMTEEDTVIRRKMRAPLRLLHVLEGASEPEMEAYQADIEANQANGNYDDYYMNKKGAITPIQGDANLDQIADVAYLLDTFFAGSPAPKGLFGYSADLKRDILEDLKKDYFDEIDALQDTQSYVYELGFRLDCLLGGINPDQYKFSIVFAERRTDTPNQRADLALKYQALGASKETVFEVTGIDTATEKDRLKEQVNGNDPYPELLPEESANTGKPDVKVTPGNQPKGESATTISTRSTQ